MKLHQSIAFSSLALLPNVQTTAETAAIEKPNVILIYADDLGKGMLSAYGQQILSTPNMDKLVKQGVQFSNAYAAHYSAPSRASLLTGYSDLHKGHWKKENGDRFTVADTSLIAPIEAELNARDVRLKPGDDYLADVFNKAGYFTGQIGKLEYGFLSSRQQVASHGWQYFYGFMDHGRCHGFFPPFLFENDKIVMIDGNTRADSGDTGYKYDNEESYINRWNMEGKEVYSQDLFNEKIKTFLHEHKDEPFFLYHPTQLPHGSVSVPYIHESLKNNPRLTPVEKEYATMVLLLDEAIGMILDELDRLKIADKTMVIFSSDNGHEIYYEAQGRTARKRDVRTGQTVDNCYLRFRSDIVGDIFNGNMGMAGNKRSNLDGGIHVPLTFYYPAKLKPYVNDELVAIYDLIPTMAEMLNVPISKEKQGISFYSLLTDPYKRLPESRYVLCDSFEGPTIIRNDGWKLRYCNVSKDYELYNLRNDPAERRNVAAQNPKLVKELYKVLHPQVQATICRGGYKPNKIK